MTVRFFMLQSHYSSTLDFSNEALTAAEKGYKKLNASLSIIKNMEYSGSSAPSSETDKALNELCDACYEHMSDDFNTAKTLAVLFEMSSRINDMKSGSLPLSKISEATFEKFKTTYVGFMQEVLGLKEEETHNHALLDGTIQVLIELRKKARTDKNFALSDKIRDDLKAIGIQLKDGKEGVIEYSID